MPSFYGAGAWERRVRDPGPARFGAAVKLSAPCSGGGLYVDAMIKQNGTMKFKNCSSEANGVEPQRCSAVHMDCPKHDPGGGIYIPGEYRLHGAAVFHHCVAKENGRELRCC